MNEIYTKYPTFKLKEKFLNSEIKELTEPVFKSEIYLPKKNSFDTITDINTERTEFQTLSNGTLKRNEFKLVFNAPYPKNKNTYFLHSSKALIAKQRLVEISKCGFRIFNLNGTILVSTDNETDGNNPNPSKLIKILKEGES